MVIDIMIGNYGHYNQLFHLNDKAEFRDTVLFSGSNEKNT